MEDQKPCDVHTVQIEQHGQRLDKLDVILDKVRNRLPNWATLGFGVLLAIIGYLVKAIV